MASARNGRANGLTNGTANHSAAARVRFSDIPSAVDIVVQGAETEEAVEIGLENLPSDSAVELCTLLENEGAGPNLWVTIALAYAKNGMVDLALDVLHRALAVHAREPPKEKVPILTCMCWFNLGKTRGAPRIIADLDGTVGPEVKTKDHYLKAATTVLNEASRSNASFLPMTLARGVLCLLKSSLAPPVEGRVPTANQQSERFINLVQAGKSFDQVLEATKGQNIWAMLGRARVLYGMGNHKLALRAYQKVLEKAPDMIDPDPRLGIGCCLWHLGRKGKAKMAWERASRLNPNSSVAIMLVGVYHLNVCSRLPTSDPKFVEAYKKAMTECTQQAFKIDKNLPLACVNFASYFYTRKSMPTVESLARKAIELTDVNALASDGWLLLARKEHLANEYAKAVEYYQKADEARGGLERGLLAAKIGQAQAHVLMKDPAAAKFRLEKIAQQTKCVEAMMIVGHVYAQEVLANSKDDKTAEKKKAIAFLEAVRLAWKDPKKHQKPDVAVLLTLARIYENDAPEKSRQCLEAVEQLELERVASERKQEKDVDNTGNESADDPLRDHLSPQLLNNLGCFHFAAKKYEEARAAFQTALNSCVKLSQREEPVDTDALVTTVSYNLARSYEAASMFDEAKKVYGGLLERHADYTDAHTRLAFIALRQSPNDEGPKAASKLIQNNPSNLEARALYGWYLSKSKKRISNLAEDPEQRHYKHTLQHFDKHDRYALTGMGNLYLMSAREMRRETEADREKRRKIYEKAVEFFDKALQLDPMNAYAAQGVAIALIEDRKDYNTAVGIYAKLRETIKDANLSVNMGHVYTELKQYSRAIDHYEAAIKTDRAKDAQVLACLGRVWFMKGKHERSITPLKQSLVYAQQALELAFDQVHLRFNVAFVQMQIAQMTYGTNEKERTAEEVKAAAEGLEEAIESLSEIAQHKNPPYPKNDIEQRANMARNTMRKQLERALQGQQDYEAANAAKVERVTAELASKKRQREEEQRLLDEIEAERKKRLAEERAKIQEQDRLIMERREEARRKEEEAEFTTDSKTGERTKKRRKRRAPATGGGSSKRKKVLEESDDEEVVEEEPPEPSNASVPPDTDGDGNGADGGEENNQEAPKKRRRLTRKGAAPARGKTQFKSSELVVESDDDA
ncbi:MAG: hypothetical protein M1823_003578 [Watsoniomyces obsoletus]|nr:MAG: hypothetical protein M1823_003578 [Watsoniomyces obsoletus]